MSSAPARRECIYPAVCSLSSGSVPILLLLILSPLRPIRLSPVLGLPSSQNRPSDVGYLGRTLFHLDYTLLHPNETHQLSTNHRTIGKPHGSASIQSISSVKFPVSSVSEVIIPPSLHSGLTAATPGNQSSSPLFPRPGRTGQRLYLYLQTSPASLRWQILGEFARFSWSLSAHFPCAGL